MKALKFGSFSHFCGNPFLILCRRHSSTLSSNDIRRIFIDYFCDVHQHTFVKSSSVAPKNDPSLLLVNAGMNQFKPIFLGTVEDNNDLSSLKRVANSQKCIRMGGKLCDLDSVGKDFRHHTFFEMLGNWSFGDYFKKEAIHMAWSLLVNVYKIDVRRIFVTYFSGDPVMELECDLETKEIWREIGVPEERIIPLSMRDNFWEMGDIGPCGVCTEIHYLLNPVSPTATADELLENALEIWNLVFMQYEKKSDGSLKTLPKFHVDTGMGLERLTSIIQGVNSNYDTDLFVPLIKNIEKLTNCPPYGKTIENPIDIAYRILADHARMFSVAVGDGIEPIAYDAGHCVRRVIRRAAWQAEKVFKVTAPADLLTLLADTVADIFQEPYPEIKENIKEIKGAINRDLKKYRKAASRAVHIFEKKFKSNPHAFTPTEAYKLHKTFGVPEEVVEELAKTISVSIDWAAVQPENQNILHNLKTDRYA